MTLTLTLRCEAEAEASRLRAARARMTAERSPEGDHISATMVRASAAALTEPGAIFFVRVRCIDAMGRLIEQIVLPVQLRIALPLRRKTETRVRSAAQQLIDRYRPMVLATARAHASARMVSTSGDYSHRLERAVRRERRLAEILAERQPGLIQPGLFDHRAIKDRQEASRRESVAAEESNSRMRVLGSIVAGVFSMDLEITMVLLVRAHT